MKKVVPALGAVLFVAGCASGTQMQAECTSQRYGNTVTTNCQ